MGYVYRCTPEMATFIWNMMIDQLTLVLRWEELRYNSLTRSVKNTTLPKHSRNFTWLTQGRSRKCWFLLNWCKVCWKRILVPWLKKQAHTLSKLWRRERRRTRIARRMQMKEVREDREDRDVRPEPGLSLTMSWHGVCPALPGWKMSEWSSRAIENPQDPESLHCVQALSSCDPSHEVDRS